MTEKLLVGIDPGKATGIAVWRGNELDRTLTAEYTVEGVYGFLQAFCGQFEVQQVEWFTISTRTTKTAVDYDAIHLIGSIKYAAWLCGHPILYTNPAEVKTQFPDAALKQAGLWHSSDHVRDATRHLCRLLVVQKRIDPKLLLL